MRGVCEKAVKQTRVEFIVSAFAQRDFPRAVIPEVVVAGRSNVGKSSLINRLTGEEGLARTSSTPGKTRSINFYRCDGSFFSSTCRDSDLPKERPGAVSGSSWLNGILNAGRQWRW